MQSCLFSHFFYYDYLLMPLCRCVSPAPVFHRLLAAETADLISMASKVEAGPGQSFWGHLLGQAGATEWVQATVHQGKILWVICLQIVVLSEITHDRTRQETAEWTKLRDRISADKRERKLKLPLCCCTDPSATQVAFYIDLYPHKYDICHIDFDRN